jgi:hypothetical protein
MGLESEVLRLLISGTLEGLEHAQWARDSARILEIITRGSMEPGVGIYTSSVSTIKRTTKTVLSPFALSKASALSPRKGPEGTAAKQARRVLL